MKRKCLAVGIILLFIGVAIAPSINFTVVKASNDNDLVEVTSQACGIQGFGNTTVKLTRQQYQNLEQYLVDFRERLNQTTTREEAVPIFKEAVVELDKYGLLPKGMSVERAQRLVTGRDGEENRSILYQRLHRVVSNDAVNALCLIAGSVTNISTIATLFISIAFTLELMSLGILYIILNFFDRLDLFYSWCDNVDNHFFVKLAHFFNSFINYLPMTICHPLYFGDNAFGWVATIGAFGIKIWNGRLFGTLPFFNFAPFYAVSGFSGLKIFSGKSEPTFILGSAFWVGIETLQ